MWTKEYEPITKREAIEFLDYFRLASCVCELKEQSLVKIRAVFVCYDISCSTLNRVRDRGYGFLTWCKRGKLNFYDLAKFNNYFSA